MEVTYDIDRLAHLAATVTLLTRSLSRYRFSVKGGQSFRSCRVDIPTQCTENSSNTGTFSPEE